MATSVTKTEEIELSDGTQVNLRPLPIKYLKKVLIQFGKYTKDITKAVEDGTADNFDPDGIKLIDNLLLCCKIALEGYKVTVENLDEVLDMETIYKILYVGADINLKDAGENLQSQALLAAGEGVLGQN